MVAGGVPLRSRSQAGERMVVDPFVVQPTIRRFDIGFLIGRSCHALVLRALWLGRREKEAAAAPLHSLGWSTVDVGPHKDDSCASPDTPSNEDPLGALLIQTRPRASLTT